MLGFCNRFVLLRPAIGLIAAVLLCASSYLAPARADYVLRPGDVVEISVYGVPDLQRKTNIGAGGQISFPLLGDVQIAGLTIASAREKLTELLAKKGIVTNPDVTVAIVEYRPFYIFGDVDKPGEYPFRANMTILQALSIAGGLQRQTEQRLLRTERDAIVAQGELNILSVQANYLAARRARLQAEIDNAKSIDFPRELKDKHSDASIALILQQEQSIFEARRDGYVTQVRALDQLKSHLEKEIDSLKAQLAIEDTQLRLLNQELKSVSSLVEKGLAVTPRQLSLERTMAQIEGERLRHATGIMRARQEISKTDIAILELGIKRTNETTLELRETQSKLEEAIRKFDTSSQLLNEAENFQSLAHRVRGRAIQPTYTILRQQGDRSVQVNATGATAVEPGDTIQVEVPLPIRPTPSLGQSGSASPTTAAADLRTRQGQSAPSEGQ